ncbi:hypothetical protein HOC01_00450 [archaeon]|jgi:prolyl 3-hydroxylase /prolyl 3,4-dihydroxylase|nr:hypothetical protein [archaeon]MBT6698690.1 hypothetical protein [archaeon]
MTQILWHSWIKSQHGNEKRVQKYHQEFQNSTPFKHIQITNFLTPKFLDLIKKKLLHVPWEEKDSDLFSLHQTPELQSITEISLIQDLATLLKGDKFQNWMTRITNIKLNQEIDLSAVTYAKHGYLLPHDDRLEGRKIAFILYLTSLKKKEGGTLDLFNTKENPNTSSKQKLIPTTIAKSFIPKENSLLFFEVSEKSWHQISEISKDCRRVTIGGWLHG